MHQVGAAAAKRAAQLGARILRRNVAGLHPFVHELALEVLEDLLFVDVHILLHIARVQVADESGLGKQGGILHQGLDVHEPAAEVIIERFRFAGKDLQGFLENFGRFHRADAPGIHFRKREPVGDQFGFDDIEHLAVAEELFLVHAGDLAEAVARMYDPIPFSQFKCDFGHTCDFLVVHPGCPWPECGLSPQVRQPQKLVS